MGKSQAARPLPFSRPVARRAQETARLVLTQLAEERNSTSVRAARLTGMIEELRAEKKALLSKVTCVPGCATALQPMNQHKNRHIAAKLRT